MTTKPKGGRPAKGTIVKTRDGRWQPILTLKDGSRKRLDPFPHGTSEAYARERATYWAEQVEIRGITRTVKPDAKGTPPTTAGDKWWDSLFKAREAKGLSPVGFLYRPHIKPALAGKHPKDWTREDCEQLVTVLDAKITSSGEDRISWKTAANVWALFTKACKVACSSKAAEGLRVRSDNPCAGVQGPERGEKKAKQWLYPSELSKLFTCERVPLRWRRLYALLTYTYVRPGELRALEWQDVNLEVGTIYVSKAWDRARGRQKAPKTQAGIRHVPIEPTLLPLLKAMREEANGTGRVMAMPPAEDGAETFRDHLERAHIDRAELFLDNETHKQITLYDLRATGITWRCLRKDYGPEIQQAAGHEKYDTTDGYIRTARVFIGRVGEPFPPLPESLMAPGFDRGFRSPGALSRALKPNSASNSASPTGFEPVLQP